MEAYANCNFSELPICQSLLMQKTTGIFLNIKIKAMKKFESLGILLSREQIKNIVGGNREEEELAPPKCDKCAGYMPACCYVTVDCCYNSANKCCNK